MKLYSKKIVIASIVMGILPLLFIFPCFGASILNGYPIGQGPSLTGLTTNTIMLINLDSPVAMIGNQPDMTYCVKKLSFSGFDYVFSDVACDVAASDDRMRVNLYPKAPQALLDINSPYAYKVVSLNFQGGGSAANFSQCYATGNNPLIPLANTAAEASLCTDYNNPNFGGIGGGNYCYKCHIGGLSLGGPIFDPDLFPPPTCP